MTPSPFPGRNIRVMPSSASQTSRVEALDLLRLVAVLGVVLYHFGFWGPTSNGIPLAAIPGLAPVAKYGFLGVPVFFIISGFVIAYSAAGRTATGFAIARFSRIYPTFVFCMTLTFLAIVLLGPPHFDTSWAQWFANLIIAAPALGQAYMDTSYWSLVIEVMFYAWVAVLIAAGLFPRRIDAIILIWLGITFANELTIDALWAEKLFLADDSGFFAVGLLIYEFYRGRRGAMLYSMLALSIGTAVFQALHKLVKLAPHTGGVFDEWIVVAICLVSVAVIFMATQVRRVPLPAGLTLALGGLTYPLYLLHMQFGYVLFEHQAPTNAVPLVVTIVSAMTLLAWAVWRYLERPAQRWTREFLTRHATRLGWPPKPDVTVGRVARSGTV
jgi:peptidoglycan/LPS O-acetylase OafA/YrhL